MTKIIHTYCFRIMILSDYQGISSLCMKEELNFRVPQANKQKELLNISSKIIGINMGIVIHNNQLT